MQTNTVLRLRSDRGNVPRFVTGVLLLASLAAPLLAAENAPIVLKEFKDVSTWVTESAFNAPEVGFYRFVVDGSRAKGRPTKIAVNLDGELLYFADQSGKDRTCDADGRLVENVYLTRGGHAVEIRGFQPWYQWDSVRNKDDINGPWGKFAELPIELKPGWNLIFFKSMTGNAGWKANFAISDPGDLEYSATPPK